MLDYFKLSSVISKESLPTTVAPHQLDVKPPGFTAEIALVLKAAVCELV
jgi:hypothetical protein